MSSPGALYEAFPPAEAKVLWDRFEFVYTPKHGSWLNVAEVELNVMTRQVQQLDSWGRFWHSDGCPLGPLG